jgi:hypothetical protein
MALKPLHRRKPGVFFAGSAAGCMRDFANPHRMQQSVFILSGAEFLLVCLGFYGLKLRANIVVIHFKFEDFFITNGIGDDIGVQLLPNTLAVSSAPAHFYRQKSVCR